MNMSGDGPTIIRPIPRRPFATANIRSAAREEEDCSSPSTPNPNANLDFSSFISSFSNHSLLSQDHLYTPPTLSRPASCKNLTSSALLGIFSQTSSTLADGDVDPSDGAVESPWASGIQTPIRRPGVHNAAFEVMRSRAQLKRSITAPISRVPRPGKEAAPPAASTLSSLDIASRAALLVILGVGYGFLVTRFLDVTVLGRERTRNLGSLLHTILTPSLNGGFLSFWGLSGLLFGGALPVADSLWRDSLVDEQQGGVDTENALRDEEEESPVDDDWSSVMRTAIVIIGIFFAIRRLAWTSSLQVSMSLAATNPLLWWLVDGTMSGGILSAFTSIVGSALLLSSDRSAMAAPSRFSMVDCGNLTLGMYRDTTRNGALGGTVNQAMLEQGLWMASVLFCSCISLGNIGRRLMASDEKGNQ